MRLFNLFIKENKLPDAHCMLLCLIPDAYPKLFPHNKFYS